MLVFAVPLILVAGSCSGPQPLHDAIDPADEQAYLSSFRDGLQTPRDAFYEARAAATKQPIAQVRDSDSAFSEEENPFDAGDDAAAVSRGAVIYKYNCMNCHGKDADGRGPDMTVTTDAMDFHRFAMRFAVTLHRGAPSRWYRVIADGTTSATAGPDGKPLVMEPFRDRLSREQIWEVITYLQSLDADR